MTTTDEERRADEEAFTFEDAVKRLEEIAKLLEEGDLPLESSLEIFEESVKVARICNSKLDSIEKRLEVLIRGKDGELEREAMELD